MRIALFALGALALADVAYADPCEAPLPAPSTKFSGQVRYIVDGDGFCVGKSSDPNTWIEVRVENFYAPELKTAAGREAKAVMNSLAYGQQASCRASHQSYDRVVATCSISGSDIGAQMRAAGVQEGGNR